MLTFFRKTYRILRLAVWFLFMALRTILAGLGKTPDEKIRIASRDTGRWARGILKILNIRLEVHGEMPQSQGVLIVSNHLGYLDIIVHASLMGVRFAPKKEIRSWPFLGWYIGLSRPVWIDRKSPAKSRQTLEEFEKTLELSVPLIVYPEGTSTDGLHGLRPFKSTPFEAAIKDNRPLMPIVTVYTVPEGAMNPAWFGDQELLPHVWVILGIKQIKADVTISAPLLPEGLNRKELAEKTRAIMLASYRELTGIEAES